MHEGYINVYGEYYKQEPKVDKKWELYFILEVKVPKVTPEESIKENKNLKKKRLS